MSDVVDLEERRTIRALATEPTLQEIACRWTEHGHELLFTDHVNNPPNTAWLAAELRRLADDIERKEAEVIEDAEPSDGVV